MGTEAAPRSISLPVALSRFCGRERELEHLRTLLAANRLVTVTGTGGAGKTRVAVEAARSSVDDFPDGRWLVELAPVDSAGLVATAIAEGVRAPENRGVTALERAARRLGTGRQLLVLDNCEHVLVAARSAAEQLLSLCPGLVILATSRETLGADGERAWSLPPMAVPPGDMTDEQEVLATEAATLFCDRAQLAAPGGGLRSGSAADVANICRRLEGLPLALELAAAWVPVLSVRQVLERLDDALAMHAPGREHLGRHRTMRAAVDWSHQLLTEPQRVAFARFSVFVGGFTLESAEAVLDDVVVEGSSSLELIAALVARSLVTSDTSGDVARYRLLEPVRQYAADQLRSRPEAERDALGRMLTYLAELAATAEGAILGGPDVPWLRRLDEELANIRSALTWGFDVGDETAARLATALPLYCFQRTMFAEGLQWARLALPTSGHLRARALLMTGWLAGELGDAALATDALREANRLMAEGGWHADLVLVLWVQGLADYIRGDLDAMEATGEEAVALAGEIGSPAHMMRALWVPATCAYARGDYRRSLELYQQAHAIAKELDNYGWAQLLLSNCVYMALTLHDTAIGRRMLAEALQSSGRGDEMCDANLVEAAGILSLQDGDAMRALSLLAAGSEFIAVMGYRATEGDVAHQRRWVEMARERVDSAAADAAWQRGLRLSLPEALAEARTGIAVPSEARRTAPSEAPPLDGNAFIREGELWSLLYRGTVVRLKDSKGLRDIAALLACPQREVSAAYLAGGRDGAGRDAAVAALHLGVEGDAGEVLDAEARAQYRARLTDLEEDINEADANRDPERAGRAREEREFLLAELRSAVGLNGRARRVLDPGERARKAVAGRIGDAIGHIETAHPALGRHLRRSVRTGRFCVYDPAEPTSWRL